MMNFRVAFLVPAGGKWFYTIPETTVYLESHQGIDALVAKVRVFYQNNKLEAPRNLRVLVEDYICRHVPKGFCEGPDPRGPSEVPLTFFAVLTKLERTFQRGKWSYVSPIEAEKRAKVCMTCKLNFLGMCTTCNGLKQRARRVVGSRTTRMDAYLGVCRRLWLPLQAVVQMSIMDDWVKNGVDDLPEICWLRKGAPEGVVPT